MSSIRPSRGSVHLAEFYGVTVAPKGDVDMNAFRPNALNQPPRFKQAIQTGKVLLGTALSIASIETASICAQLNFDWCFIDAEHTPMSPQLMADLIRTVHFYSEGSTAAVVHLPTHGHEWIAWALDAGTGAIVLPHTENAEQARDAVRAARFAPLGKRSYAPFALLPGHNDGTPEGKTPFDVWNANAAVIMQIDSARGVQHAGEIAAVNGVDAIMISAKDLRLHMGLPGLSGNEAEYLRALDTIQRAAKANNVPIMGSALDELQLKMCLTQGWTILMTGADAMALVGRQAALLVQARHAVEEFNADELRRAMENDANGYCAGRGRAKL